MKTTNTLFKQVNLLAIAIVSLLYAQNAFGQDDSWKLKTEQNGIKIYSKQVNCAGAFYFVLKVENTSANTANVNYTISIKDNPTLPPTISGTVSALASGSSVESTCSNLIDKLWAPSPTAETTDESFDISIIAE